MVNIDLHAYETVDEALQELEKQLFRAFSTQQHTCLIVHGIGEGVLKDAVHEALNKNPLVRRFSLDENGGSTTVEI